MAGHRGSGSRTWPGVLPEMDSESSPGIVCEDVAGVADVQLDICGRDGERDELLRYDGTQAIRLPLGLRIR